MWLPIVDLVACARPVSPSADGSGPGPPSNRSQRSQASWIWLLVAILLGLGFAVMPELVGGSAVC